MKRFEDCTYSAFVSYAHADDTGGWVTTFTTQLQELLRARVRKQLKPFPEPHQSGLNGPAAGVLSEQLQRNVDRSFAMVVVVGPNYLKSDWCGEELKYFHQTFGDAGLRSRLFIVAMCESAIQIMQERPLWRELQLQKQVWKNFFSASQPEQPMPQYLRLGTSNMAVPNPDFQDCLAAILGPLADEVQTPTLAPPPAPVAPPPQAAQVVMHKAVPRADVGTVLIGYPAPELAAEVANVAAALEARGLKNVRRLDESSFMKGLPDFDEASTLVLPIGTGGTHLPAYEFTPGGHLQVQRMAWQRKKGSVDRLHWLDLRHVPCSAEAPLGHAELLAEIGGLALAPEALADLLAPRPADRDADADADAETQRINIYIESNQNEVDLWKHLGARIKRHWIRLAEQRRLPDMPPLHLHARAFAMQRISKDPLPDCDGVILLWGRKSEDSLLAQIDTLERKHLDPPPGIVAFLIPQQPDPQVPVPAERWTVLCFQDANGRNVDIVPREQDRLEDFLLEVLQRYLDRQGIAVPGGQPHQVAA